MLSITHINQIPEYIKSIERQKDMLCVAEGFTPQDITDMIAIYDAMIDKVNNIMARGINVHDAETVETDPAIQKEPIEIKCLKEIEVFNPETVK